MYLEEVDRTEEIVDGFSLEEISYDAQVGESRVKVLGNVLLTIFQDKENEIVFNVDVKVSGCFGAKKTEVTVLALEKKIEILEKYLIQK